MRNYNRVHPRKPEGIENRKAYIVGGIAGLAAAAFPVDDAGMSGENITIYKKAAGRGWLPRCDWHGRCICLSRQARIGAPHALQGQSDSAPLQYCTSVGTKAQH